MWEGISLQSPNTRKDRVGDLVSHHCTRTKPMLSSVIRIEAIDDLLMECIAVMVVRIYRSLGTQ
jgi:hypothetical protein